MSTPFELFLLELAKVLQFPTLAPDSNGACLILMKNGNVPILFEFDDQLVPNTVLVSAFVTTVGIAHRADIYEASLMGNMEIEQTLSVKPDEDALYLHTRYHPQIQAAEIEQRLHFFLNTVKAWQAKVEEIIKQPPRSDRFPPLPPSIQVFPYKA